MAPTWLLTTTAIAALITGVIFFAGLRTAWRAHRKSSQPPQYPHPQSFEAAMERLAARRAQMGDNT